MKATPYIYKEIVHFCFILVSWTSKMNFDILVTVTEDFMVMSNLNRTRISLQKLTVSLQVDLSYNKWKPCSKWDCSTCCFMQNAFSWLLVMSKLALLNFTEFSLGILRNCTEWSYLDFLICSWKIKSLSRLFWSPLSLWCCILGRDFM